MFRVYYSLLLIPFIAFADNSITLNKVQLDMAKEQLRQNGQQAVEQMPKYSRDLSTVKLNQLDLITIESDINQSQTIFKDIKPLTNKLPNGDKYYLYSESIVNDFKEFLAQQKTPLDINQTISDYNALVKNAKTKIGNERLIIFISSSMPKKTLINLMSQASNIGAVFVIRGLINGSYVNTYRYFYNLKGNNTVGIMLNPSLFKAMQVDSVPTFALYQAEQDLMTTACNVTPKYTKVSGEVSVHYALEQLTHSTNSELAQIAANEIDILGNINFYKGKLK